ncbi:MAG: hypothetical protein LBL44_08730, partial [Treponema sp.]|nr:hypothetical protein [Treponema sp.]
MSLVYGFKRNFSRERIFGPGQGRLFSKGLSPGIKSGRISKHGFYFKDKDASKNLVMGIDLKTPAGVLEVPIKLCPSNSRVSELFAKR